MGLTILLLNLKFISPQEAPAIRRLTEAPLSQDTAFFWAILMRQLELRIVHYFQFALPLLPLL